jgi:hypothetical protein
MDFDRTDCLLNFGCCCTGLQQATVVGDSLSNHRHHPDYYFYCMDFLTAPVDAAAAVVVVANTGE